MISLNVSDTETEVVDGEDAQFVTQEHGVTSISGEELAADAEADAGGTEGEPGGDAERPSWLPEKFASAEDMAKAYSELEKKFSKGASSNPLSLTDTPAPTTATDTPAPTKAAGKVDMGALATEYQSNGKLSEATYAAIEAAGISRQAADTYIRGVQAEAAVLTSAVAEVVGGEEEMHEVLGWARTNLTPGQKSVFEAAVRSGDADAASLAMQGIFARFTAANGQEPNLVKATGKARAGSVKPFESLNEASRAMEDIRYREDPKYRKEIERRIAVSNW